MDVAIYLMKQKTRLDAVIPREKLKSEYTEVEPVEDAEKGMKLKCFVRVPEAVPAKWFSWIEPYFQFGDDVPKNQAGGCVLAFRANKRVFALAFGTGWHAVDATRIEPDFGIRVAVQRVSPEKVRHLVSKTVDLRTRETSTYRSSGGGVSEFSVDLDVEWLRSLSGTPEDQEHSSLVAGAEAVRLRGYKGSLKDVVRLSKELLDDYKKDPPEVFSFIDRVRPIGKKDALHVRLEEKVRQRVEELDFVGMDVIVDFELFEKASLACLRFGRNRRELPDLSCESIWSAAKFLKDSKKISPAKLRLVLQDADGVELASPLLLRVIQAEIEMEGKTYLRLEQRWFEVGEDYIDYVNERLSRLDDLTATLSLPAWRKGRFSTEAEYNEFVSQKKGWLLQDSHLIQPAGGKGASFEPCDLLTADAHFIHVKEGTSSSSLNHLFGQIGAAAELYSRHNGVRSEVNDRYSGKWGQELEEPPTFVAAIGRKHVKEDLLGRMLVAKVNLLDQARRVNGLNFGFALAGFKVIPSSKKTAAIPA